LAEEDPWTGGTIADEDGMPLLEELGTALDVTDDLEEIPLDDGAEEYNAGVLATGELSDT
jgi:hypothetical protein